MSSRESYDIIVVGSGAAGGWAAKELTENGLTVLLLEAGRTVSSEIDFPVPAPREQRILARFIAGLTGQPIQMRCPAFNQRTRRFFVSDRENPYTTPKGKPFNWFRGRQVGGRLPVWARVVVRLSDLEFKSASRDGHGADWPLSYRDLAPYYDKVEAFLEVYGDPDGIAAAPDGKYVGAAEMTPEERDFKTAVETAFPDRRVTGARIARQDPGGIPLPIRAAQRTGRLTLRSNAVVSRITTHPETGKATGVVFVDRVTKKPEKVRAQIVMLCASAIETLRILLNSASLRHPAGLGNSSGRLGHYLMDHILSGIGGPLPYHATPGLSAEGDPYDFGQVTGLYIPRFQNTDVRHPDFLRGYAMQGGIGRGGPYWYLFAHGEMLPRFENRVTMDPNKRDAWGIPVARISCTHSSNETAMVADQLKTMREMAHVASLQIRIPPSGRLVDALAFDLWKRRLICDSGAFWPGSAIHELGGAGMGEDPGISVLNPYNQCWDATNVFVTDGACFPSGCCQNVTLTIMALTVRACDYLVRTHRTGGFK
jgi:choline dehydrogenase-like flavoprotein